MSTVSCQYFTDKCCLVVSYICATDNTDLLHGSWLAVAFDTTKRTDCASLAANVYLATAELSNSSLERTLLIVCRLLNTATCFFHYLHINYPLDFNRSTKTVFFSFTVVFFCQLLIAREIFALYFTYLTFTHFVDTESRSNDELFCITVQLLLDGLSDNVYRCIADENVQR